MLMMPFGGAAPTFHADVEKILQQHCQECHRKGDIGPMPLTSYAETRPWAKAIRNSVVSKRMPPWFADMPKGHFLNDLRVDAEEIDTIVKWVDGGAPAGDPKKAPAPRVFSSEWRMGKPDRIITIPKALPVEKSGEMAYRWVLVPLAEKEDLWVEALEYKMQDPSVVHHISTYIRPAGSKWMADVTPGEFFLKAPKGNALSQAGGILTGYVPGRAETILASGRAMRIPAGADLVMEIHATPTGKEGAVVQPQLGLRFARSAVKEEIRALPTGEQNFAIPPELRIFEWIHAPANCHFR
jgi:hypothetical protein